VANDKTRIVWIGPAGPRHEDHADVRFAEERAKALREHLLAEEWRGTVELISPLRGQKAERRA